MIKRRRESIGIGLALWLGALASAACAPGDRGASDGPGTSTLERLTGEVERGVVAVMPFNVSGAESDLGYLETALPDLLSRKLNYRDPPERVFDATDLPSARRQALEAGAMDVVMGAVVGGADRLTIRAALRRTRAGRVLAEESVTGGLDSLDALTSRLALQLTLWDLDPAARAIIGSTPTPVIDATLDGYVALWQEDWVGAADAFQAALAIDSTFGIAAEGLYRISSNVRSTATLDRAEVNRLVQLLRGRMTAAGRAGMDAGRMPDTARVWTVLKRLRAVEAAAAAYPNHPGIWNRLAYDYYWRGAYVGVEDWYRRALHAFQQSDEILDRETPCEAYNHLLLRQVEPDSEMVAAYARACGPEQWPNPAERVFQRLLKAAILRDTAELRRLRSGAALDSIGSHLGAFPFYFVQEGYGLKEWRAAIQTFERNATTETQRLEAKRNQLLLARVAGRPSEATSLLRERLGSGLLSDPWADLTLPIKSALLEPGWEDAARDAGERMMRPDPSWPDTLKDGPGWNNTFDRLCHAEIARLARGDTMATRRSVATLRDVWESELPGALQACPELLDALHERLSGSGESRALARLDSVASLGPWPVLDATVTNLVLARLHHQRGEIAEAWKWVRRRVWSTQAGLMMPPWLRSEGQIAAAVGAREHAIRAYRQYLVLREDPEPVLVPQRDSVLAELACLDPELPDRRDPATCAELLGDG